ncbi:MAG: energy-coupling factor ABC transporter ATP-binding protein [Clostridiales bacterium]|nr:energy-coupling factor ABC transporter ATP-binding protein [Clostridiales bacterium]
MAALEIKNLTFCYPTREIPALKDVSLSIDSGEFVVICGKSGSGKSTLLRHMKTVLTPHGKRSGNIFLDGRPLESYDLGAQAEIIGFVLQDPDSQIVTDKVWHELAFGLESLGTPPDAMRLRVAEMASFFGIENWFYRDVVELSGGQKQLLNLAAAMTVQPDILILDEPTAQLDPIAGQEFIDILGKINRELGTTVILSEHRLDQVFAICHRAIVMDTGRIVADDTPHKVGALMREGRNDMFFAMPAPVQIYAKVKNTLPCPLTIREGRLWLSRLLEDRQPIDRQPPQQKKDNHQDAREQMTVISMKNVWFRYEKGAPDVIKDLSLDIKEGELFCILGGNGTGKTTALSLMSRINKPYRGKILLYGKQLMKYSASELFDGLLGMLPQNPQALFVKNSVRLDLSEMLNEKIPKKEKEERIAKVAALTEIEDLLDAHPYDLSGGEQQRAALAKLLLQNPKILLLDEPTKGLDSFYKIKLADILKRLAAEGVTVVLVSHDIEFCARHATRCGLLFDGHIIAKSPPAEFFTGNSFYTTAANRMARHIFPEAVTNEDVIKLCNILITREKG